MQHQAAIQQIHCCIAAWCCITHGLMLKLLHAPSCPPKLRVEEHSTPQTVIQLQSEMQLSLLYHGVVSAGVHMCLPRRSK